MPEKLIAIKGSVPVNKHQRIGPADPTAQIHVTVKLRRKTEVGLPTHAQFIAGKRARGITRQILAERYGAKREDADAVQEWAIQQGLSVARRDLGLRQLHLVGSIAAMSAAFGVKISEYMHVRKGVLFHCPEADIRIPKSLAGIITGVFGLNTMPVVFRHGLRVAQRAAAQADPKTMFPGSFYPNEVAKLYGFPPTQGAGQRVAILEFGGGFDQSVLKDYFTKNIGLKTPPTVNGIPVLNTPMNVNDGATGEVYLDIEVIGSMAPGATMDVYFAPWTADGYVNAIQLAIHNDDYAAISISYGIDEDQSGSAANPGWSMLHQAVDEAFQEATAIGVPVFVSTGDQGSSSIRGFLDPSGQDEVTVFLNAAHAGYPSTSPYATAVGGTMLYADNGGISQEIVWNELGQTFQGQYYNTNGQATQGKFYLGGAGGGGVSTRYPVPSYQTKAGIHPKSANTSGASGRGVPDVAGNSGSSTGYLVSQPPGAQFPIAPVGGTSAAAPMWAALMACIRESLTTTFDGKIPVYFFNDFVYAVGTTTAFRDIVGGRDLSYDPKTGAPIVGAFTPIGNIRSTQANGYNAAKGYDLCTGWGSPNGVQLQSQLENWLKKLPKTS